MVDERKAPEGYRVTEVGVIPEDWDVKKLGKIGEPIIGLTYKPENIAPYGMLVLRSSNIDNNMIDLEDSVYVDVQVRDRLIVEENDLLICVRNGSRRLIGKCALISKEVAGVTFGAFMSLYKSDFSRYIFQYFQTNSIKKQIEENMGATINQITNKSLSNFLIAIPQNHNEQESIIEALTDTDNLLQSLKKLIDKKKKIKQGAMQQLLTGKKRLPGFTGEWEVKKIADFTFISSGGTPSTRIPEYWNGNIRWMNSGELNLKRVYEVEGRITESGLNSSSTRVIPENSVLIGLAGQGKTRGTASINYVDLCINQSIAAIFPSNLHDSEYLYQNLDSRYDELRSMSTGDGGRGGLNLKIIRNLMIPLPSLKEQKAIAQVLSDMDTEIEALEEKLEKYKTIKQGMMQELLTGRIRLI